MDIKDLIVYKFHNKEDISFYDEEKGNYQDVKDPDNQLESILEFVYFQYLEVCMCYDIANEALVVHECLVKMLNQEWDWVHKDEKLHYYRILLLKFLDTRKLINHGTSIWCSWLTNDGMDFLHDLDIVLHAMELIDTPLSDEIRAKLKQHELPRI